MSGARHRSRRSDVARWRELAAANEQLREEQRLAGIGSWAWDLDSGAHAWSAEIYRIYGRDPALPPADYPGVRQYFTPASWEPLAAAVEQALAAGMPYACDAEVVRPDGSRRWISVRGAAVRDAAGNIVKLHGTVQDITERKLAEQERVVTVDFLTLINAAGSKRDLIAAAATFFQRDSACEAIGIRLKEGDDYPYYEAHGFPREFVVLENSLCARDAAGQPVRDAAGYPIMECMCGSVICGRFNPAKPFFTPGGSFWSNCTTELLATTTEADRQARTRNRCNGEGYESVALIPLRSGGESLGLLQVNDRRRNRFTPETIARWELYAGYLAVAIAKFNAAEKRKLAEGALRELNADLERRVAARTAELQAANRELESFSYSVSHDLRAPLRAMQGFSSILREDCRRLLDEDCRGLLDRVCASADRMDRLIGDLLGLSRISRTAFAREKVNLSELARELAEELRQAEPQREVQFRVADGITALGDPGLLRIALQNLIGNAWKFTAGRAPAHIEFGLAATGAGTATYFVRDDGVGFDMAYADELFCVFQRLHAETDFPGTGIGLATVQRIVARHGGRIWAEAAPGCGAAFFFELPSALRPTRTSTRPPKKP